MRRLLLTPIFIISCLVLGCSSFNNSFNTYITHPANASEPVKPIVAPEVKPPMLPAIAEDNDAEFKCPPFRYETSGRGPELPEDQIAAAGNDIYRIEEIERQHIKDLRAHIAKMQRRLKLAMAEHEVKCRLAANP